MSRRPISPAPGCGPTRPVRATSLPALVRDYEGRDRPRALAERKRFRYLSLAEAVRTAALCLTADGTLATLRIEAFDVAEFVLLGGGVDDANGQEQLDDEQCAKLIGLPARVVGNGDGGVPPPSRLDRQIEHRLRETEQRNARIFDEEVAKLDRWSADLKDGLERELREIDRLIQEAGRSAALAQTLAAKIEAQRRVRDLEATRTRKRRERSASR